MRPRLGESQPNGRGSAGISLVSLCRNRPFVSLLLVQLQTEVGRALTDAGKELAQSEEILNLDMESTAAGISMAYTKHCLDTCLEGRAAGRMIKGGARGISLLGCRLEGQDSFWC